MPVAIERKTCAAPDGVQIVYSAGGSGPIGLVFIHGGLANRSFWDGELKQFAAQYRVIAPDLPGHGDSGSNRRSWGIPEYGTDVYAVIEAEHLNKVILFGNSLGGPVAIGGVAAAQQSARRGRGRYLSKRNSHYHFRRRAPACRGVSRRLQRQPKDHDHAAVPAGRRSVARSRRRKTDEPHFARCGLLPFPFARQLRRGQRGAASGGSAARYQR